MAAPTSDGTYDAAVEVMTAIRGAKTASQKSLRWPVDRLKISGPERHREALAPVLDDVLRAGNVENDGVRIDDGASPEGQRFDIEVELADAMPE